MSAVAHRFEQPSLLAAHHPLGMSTGVFDELRDRWIDLVSASCRISSHAIELSALSGDELPGLIDYLRAAPRLPFRYVSVHGPTKQLGSDEAALIRELERVPLWIRSIVMHPDTLTDVARFRRLGTRLVIENMDERKSVGQTADELGAYFDVLPDAGFCLDVAHASVVDPTMDVAHEMLDRFRSRLRQVHISSLADGTHVPLTEQDEEQFAGVLERCHDVPWILEASPPSSWRPALRARTITTAGSAFRPRM